MWKASYFIGSIFLFSFWTSCYATLKDNDTESDEVPLTMRLVKEIVRKVCNLSLDSFSNKSPQEKATLLIKIEEKLNKSAQSLGGQGIKYVRLIMKGVRSSTFENQVSDNTSVDFKTNDLIARTQETKKATRTSKSKEELIHNIANRIGLLAKAYLYSAKTDEERKEAIDFIKNKLLRSVNRKHSLKHSKPEDIKNYVGLVAKGFEAIMYKNAKNRERRMEYSYSNNIDLKGNTNNDSQNHNSVFVGSINLHNKLDNIGSDIAKKYKSVSFNINRNIGFKSLLDTNPFDKFSCHDAMKETCRKIKLVQIFHCLSDRKEINVIQLCDGVGDCTDFSDEKNCAKQAIEGIHNANLLMTHIENSLSHRCFPDMVDESMIAKQNKILNDVLQNQLSFIHKHSVIDSSKYSRKVFTPDTDSIRQTVNEAVNVVDALASALDSTICSKSDKNSFRRQNDYKYDQGTQQIEDVMRTSTWSPEFCKCDGQKCIKACTSSCKRICWEIYSLAQFHCDAINGEKTVSLDMICDGKLDCYDESDEKDCSADSGLSRFQATQMYNYVLNEIKSKALSMAMEVVKSKLLNLHALVSKLQKFSLDRNAGIMEVKQLREASFVELSEVYKTSLHYVDSTMDLIDTYVYLFSMNERLISALKRSNTGNEKIISSNSCLCTGYQCALPRCTKACIQMCSVEPIFTRYFCTPDSFDLNNSVPIEFVCNGRKNCPTGDDENDCKKEVCRSYHLVVLRHKIRDVGETQQGTALGEALKSWKVKVTSTLKVAESNVRPTQVVIREVVHDVLHDLVMAYTTITANNRSDIFQEFNIWARVVMDLLKSCSH